MRITEARVVACLFLLVFVASCGGSSSKNSGASSPLVPTTQAPSAASTAPPSVDTTPGVVETPSKNIACSLGYIDTHELRCDITDSTWQLPPRPASCNPDYDYGGGITMTADGAAVNCAGDTIRDQNDRVDPAGTTARQGTFSCEIQAASVSCSDSATGHAFSMSASTFSVS